MERLGLDDLPVLASSMIGGNSPQAKPNGSIACRGFEDYGAFNSFSTSKVMHDELLLQEFGKLTRSSATLEDFASTSPLPHLPIASNVPNYFMNPMDCIIENFSSSSGFGEEEDGVSTIFSNCDNIKNMSYSGNASSGESENYCLSYDQCLPNPDATLLGSYKDINHKRKLEAEFDCPETYTGMFEINFEGEPKKEKRSRVEKNQRSSNIEFRQANWGHEATTQVKEMIYRAATFRPVNLGAEVAEEKPRRRNVKISSDPQTVAARQRRERISERLRVLQKLVPGGNKLDTASMLDEAANYLKFLKSQLGALENIGKTLCSFTTTSASLPYYFNASIQTLIPDHVTTNDTQL